MLETEELIKDRVSVVRGLAAQKLSLVAAMDLIHHITWEEHDTGRKEAFISNTPDSPYYYGGGRGFEVRPYYPQEKPNALVGLWNSVQEYMKMPFEGCFLNLYENSDGNIGWHGDNSPSIDPTRPVCILTLGDPRPVLFKELSTGETIAVNAGNGDLTIMHPGIQTIMHHCVPPVNWHAETRISLVFRGLI